MQVGDRIQIYSQRQQYPPDGATGWVAVDHGRFLFVPDSVEGMPPDISPEEFGGYGLAGLTFQVLRDKPNVD